jgi:acyl dehydratase
MRDGPEETGMQYFEDVRVGHRQSFGRYTVTREEVVAFAEKYDPQPFHLSDEAAAQTHFGRLSASGWHTCAMTMAMIVANMRETEVASLGSPGIDELRWLRPVYPGDTLRCESEVIEKRPSASRPEMGLTRSRTTVFNQDDVAVMSFVSNGMIRTRPQAAAEAEVEAHPS